MADFCRVCTIELMGEEFADKNDMMRGNMTGDQMALGLCEHCGPGWFDRDGYRVVQLGDPCSICGEPWEDHYRPETLKYKLGPNGGFGLLLDHAPHVAGYHAPRRLPSG